MTAEAETEAAEVEATQEPGGDDEMSRFTDVLERNYGQGDVEDDSVTDEPESVDESVEDDSAPAIDEALISRAAEYGISEEELAEMGDKAPALVNKFAQAMDRQVAEMGKAKLEASQTPAKDDAAPKEQPAKEAGLDVLSVLKEDGYAEDDALYKVVEAMQGALNQALTAQQPQAVQEQFDNSLSSELDNLFSGLGEEYKGLIGEGSIWDYKQGTKEHGFVNDVLSQMSALDAGYAAQGKVLPTKDLFQKAMALASHEHLKEITRKEILAKVKKQSGSATSTPASKATVEATRPLSKEETLSSIASAMRETGFMDL